jgi:4a-hydroxytetrahydrobiopterin dehydratase
MSETIDLTQQTCVACEGLSHPLSQNQVDNLMPQLHEWQTLEQAKMLYKEFKFKDFYQTMAFVNAVAWIANQENHHPDIEVGYNYCHIKYFTHAIDGLSQNDFICAAKIDKLVLG